MGEEMILLICITALSIGLLWLPHIGKKEYHPNDMLWVMYIANREMRDQHVRWSS